MSKDDEVGMRRFRRRHVIRYLNFYGPVSVSQLRKAIPGNRGGDPVVVARNLIANKKLDSELLIEE
jgi:hypothetical protein